MKRVIVTGGLGFIGSNLVEHLLDKGYDVRVIDSNRESKYIFNDATYYYNDITKEIHNHSDIFEGVDAIFHLAAEIYVQKSLEFPTLFKDVNEDGTKNILNYAAMYNIKNFIFSSTSAIYGNKSNGGGSLESDEVECLNAYSQSKYNAEQICKEYSKQYSMNISSLRYFNVYGNRQHESGQYAPAIGKFLKQKENNEPITVTGDGKQTRDFINVLDVVKANYDAYKGNKDFNIYNIGSADNISIVDLAKMISNDIVFIPKRAGECQHTLANIKKAQKALKWTPTITIENYLKDINK